MANVRRFADRNRDVGTPSVGRFPQTLENIFSADGFGHELEESDDVIWSLMATNPGPKDVRVVYCKPYTFGPYQIVERFLVPHGSVDLRVKIWRADNEDHFFFFEIADAWSPVPGGGANCVWRSDANNTYVEWYGPQRLVLQVKQVIFPVPGPPPVDQIVSADVDGDGRDELLPYRPGRGAASLVGWQQDDHFQTIFDHPDAPGRNRGVGPFDLLSTADRVIADGKDELLLYRPGAGACSLVKWEHDDGFTVVFDHPDAPHRNTGIGPFDLKG